MKEVTRKQIAESIIEYLNQNRPPYKWDDSDRPSFVDMIKYSEKKLFPNGDVPEDFEFRWHVVEAKYVRYNRKKNAFVLSRAKL